MTISATTQGLRPGVCTSTSRPSAPFDGMMIYETDTNLVRIWNGTAWKTLAYSDYTNGTVLQVVSTTKTDTYTHSSGITFTNVTGLSASITPISTSHKVLVSAQVSAGGNSGSIFLKITGGNSASFLGDAASNRTRIATAALPAVNTQQVNAFMMYLDSPATTSSTTYQVQIAAGDNVTTTYVNRTPTDTDSSTYTRAASTITLMEIAA